MKNATLESMKSMKLLGMASSYEATMQLPINQQPDKHEMIAAMLDAEQQYRAKKKMDMYIRRVNSGIDLLFKTFIAQNPET